MTDGSRQEAPPTAAPRAVALTVLQAVLRQGRSLDESLSRNAALQALEPRDRGFVRSMVATTLRRLGQIDALIGHCIDRPLRGGAAPTVQDVLRLGICQLVFMDLPAHAAVDRSVRLIADQGFSGFKGLVNAVLRRLASEGPALVSEQDAVRLNTPAWLWQSWSASFGEAVARTIVEAHHTEPPLDFTVRRDTERWAEALEARVLPNGSLRRALGGAVDALPGFRDGAWWVQDAAAALPARLLGDVSGRRVIDLCAAPGGKTAQLASAGATVTAVERSPARVRQLKENLARLNLDAETVVADAALWRPPEPVGLLLLDAPCTATGTIRRHPDIPHLKRPEDVSRMTAQQDRLLDAALEMLTPGGVLLYAVCSLQPEEGPARIAALRSRGAPVTLDPIRPDEVPGLGHALTPDGAVRTLPCHWPDLEDDVEPDGGGGGLDGFYIARLQRL